MSWHQLIWPKGLKNTFFYLIVYTSAISFKTVLKYISIIILVIRITIDRIVLKLNIFFNLLYFLFVYSL